MSRASQAAKHLISAAIVLCVTFFFYNAFRRNWASIKAQQLTLRPVSLLLAAAAVLGCCLLATYAWHLSMNSLSGGTRLRFSQSVAAFNVSALTKYIPGKIWSYALQMYWLADAGFSKSLILFVNLINTLISLAVTSMVGFGYLLISPSRVPSSIALGGLVVLLLVDALTLRFYPVVMGSLVRWFNRTFKRQMAYVELPAALMLKLHLVHLAAAAVSGLSAYLVCLGVGYDIGFQQATLLMSASLLSDVIGFLAVFVPGGLGVREGAMYFILGGLASGSLSLILPVVSRIVSMLVDLVLGAVSLRFLRDLTRFVATTEGGRSLEPRGPSA